MTSDRLIRFLLRLYPAAFRERYGNAMLAFDRDLRGERPRRSRTMRIVADHILSAAAEHMRTPRSSRPPSSMSSFVQDVRYAMRSLARRPVFAVTVLATIALGVGANAAIFSVVNGILIRPLAYPHAERVVAVGHAAPHWLASQPEFVDYQRDLRSFEAIAAYTRNEANLATETEPERVPLASVSPDFFRVLGVSPARGRVFGPDEDVHMPATVAILSHGLWERRFGADSAIVGKTISLNGLKRTVVGVMPPNFDYPTAHTDVWLPMPRINRDSAGDRTNHYLFMVGRLQPDASVERALLEANALTKRTMRDFASSYDPNQPLVATISRVSDALVGPTRPYLWALFGAVGFVLLIVCANVANLLLARGEGRRKEIALRTALGATRARLATQLFTECLVLALTGGALGVLLAWGGNRALVAMAPASIPRLDEIAVDWTVLSYALATSLLAGLLFGVVPALRAVRQAPADTLKAGGKTAHHASSRAARRALVVAEVAVAVVLLTGAGMLLRSLVNLQRADMGFDSRSVLTAKVSPSNNSYNEQRTVMFYGQLLERVRALPGVQSAGAAGWLPVVEAGGLWGLLAEGQSYATLPQGPVAVPQQVTPGYFRSMGMPLVAGREFTDADRQGGPYVAVVSAAMARQLWPNADPLGKRFRLGGAQTFMTVVGVVNDIRARGFTDTPEPTMYFPQAQTQEAAYFMPRAMSLVIRTHADPMAVANQVRAIVRSLDPAVPVSNVRTLEQVVGTSVANRRFSTMLIAAFAALALVLAGIGIFGVISYGVSQRTFEIGVRMALGAEKSSVLTLIVGDGVRMALIGIAIGLAGAAGAGRAIQSLLVDVPTFDITTLLAVSAALAVVAIVASALPARRAMAVSPTEALRGE